MKLIAGLGNPGEKYQDTRHNIGFVTVDALAKKMAGAQWNLDKKFNSDVCDKRPLALLVKPQTFMNSSGDAISKIARFYKVTTSDIWIIHDDLDIRLGEYKIEQGHGPKLHNGINSIEEKLGSESFLRIRIGVDARESGNRVAGEEYVLQKFEEHERDVVIDVVEKVVDELIVKLKE